MLRINFNALAAVLGMTVSGAAWAQAKVDFVAQSLTVQTVLTDDVSGAQAQLVSIAIKNIGNTASRYPGSIIRVLLNGAVENGNEYGSNGVGGYNLDAPIAPGQLGLITLYLPVNTLHNCELVTTQIDADRTYQYGGDVFSNDTKNFFVIDHSANRVCIPNAGNGRIGGSIGRAQAVDESEEVDAAAVTE